MIKLDKNKIRKLKKACSEHCVDKLYLFGSAVTGDFNELNSDIDLVVQFTDELDVLDFADNYYSLLDALKDLFERDIDLLSYRALKNPVLIEEIEKHKVQLYAA